MQGRYALFPIEQGDAPKDWLIHRMDPPADPAREPMPEAIVPMLARAGELPRAGRRAGRMRSSGTGCGRWPTASRASCAWRAAT